MSCKYLYEAKGFVVGNLWGGGYGYYPAEKFKNSKKKQLDKLTEITYERTD